MPPRPTTSSTEAAEDRVIFPGGEWGGVERDRERQKGRESGEGKRAKEANGGSERASEFVLEGTRTHKTTRKARILPL